jgi:serine/threonine-protein kinase
MATTVPERPERREASTALDALKPGSTLDGKYQLKELLGRGGMGRVFLAEHLGTGKQVALKVMLADIADEDTIQRFQLEARAAAAIRHSGVVDVYDVGRTPEGNPYLVMECLRGETWRARMERQPPPTFEEIGMVLGQALETIAAAHDAGIVHRDLKPENLFVVSGLPPQVKVLDFGLARFRRAGDVTQTQSGAVLGTPLYMAPEQAHSSRSAGPAADIYSIGAILYHAVTGRPPFEGETPIEVLSRLLTQPIRPVLEVRPDAPKALAELIESLLNRDPDQRPANAMQVRNRLLDATRFRDEQTAPSGSARTVISAHQRKSKSLGLGNRPLRVGARIGLGIGASALLLSLAFGVSKHLRGLFRTSSGALAGARPTKVEPKTQLVLVSLPGGSLEMGCIAGDTNCAKEEERRHVDVAPFWIGRDDVTAKAYAACIEAGQCDARAQHYQPEHPPGHNCNLEAGRLDHPMNCVNWSEAQSFCQWLGGTLPTSEQWEFAARSGQNNIYPWGNEPPNAERANLCDFNCIRSTEPNDYRSLVQHGMVRENENDHYAATSPSGAFPQGATPWGLLDMAGNVQQWTSTDFAPAVEGKPLLKEVRGGSYTGDPNLLRTTSRWRRNPAEPQPNIGFRCVFP